jgi:hypothetical protein
MRRKYKFLILFLLASGFNRKLLEPGYANFFYRFVRFDTWRPPDKIGVGPFWQEREII